MTSKFSKLQNYSIVLQISKYFSIKSFIIDIDFGGRYDQAADAIRHEIGLQQQCENIAAIGRLAVALVLVQLARGDTVAAEKAFKEWGNSCEAPEVNKCRWISL